MKVQGPDFKAFGKLFGFIGVLLVATLVFSALIPSHPTPGQVGNVILIICALAGIVWQIAGGVREIERPRRNKKTGTTSERER